MSSDFRLAYPTDSDPNTLFTCLQNIISLLNGNSKFASPIDLSKYNTPSEAVVKIQNSAPSSPAATFLDKNGNVVFEVTSEGVINGPSSKPMTTSENTQTLKNKTLNVSDSNTFSGITGAMLSSSANIAGSQLSSTAGITAAQLASGVLFDMKSFLVRRTTNQTVPNGTNDIVWSTIEWQPSGSTVWSGGAAATINIPATGKWVIVVLLNNDNSIVNQGEMSAWLRINGSSSTADIIRFGIDDNADVSTGNMGGVGIFMGQFTSGDSILLQVESDNGPSAVDMQIQGPAYIGGFRIGT